MERKEGVLGSERKMISGSLNRKSVSQSISLEVSKPGCQEEPRRKRLLEEENARKTAMLMEMKHGDRGAISRIDCCWAHSER